MKAIVATTLGLISFLSAAAQQMQGTVTYERTSQVQIRIDNMPGGLESQLPKTRTDKFDLVFGNGQSVWKAAEQDNETEDIRGEGMQIRMIVAGNDDVLYNHFANARRVEKRELFDRTFIIDDSIRSMKWKMSGETKNILGLPCMKATATNISTRSQMTMEDGKMERKEIQDTALFVAWFTSNVPVPAGPAEYQGQLPGLILEMDISNGRQVFKATSISEKADLALIKEPTGKKRYTQAEFRKEREKMLDEMQQNNRGGNRVIRMN